MMPVCSVDDLKTKSDTLISDAQQGKASVILHNNRPVAALVPYSDVLEDVLEEIAWLTNKDLQKSILEANEAKTKPILALRYRSTSLSDNWATSVPSTMIFPEFNRSKPPIMFNSVVFPHPLGPIITVISPG